MSKYHLQVIFYRKDGTKKELNVDRHFPNDEEAKQRFFSETREVSQTIREMRRQITKIVFTIRENGRLVKQNTPYISNE